MSEEKATYHTMTDADIEVTKQFGSDTTYYLFYWSVIEGDVTATFALRWDRPSQQFVFEGDPAHMDAAAQAFVDQILSYATEQTRAILK